MNSSSLLRRALLITVLASLAGCGLLPGRFAERGFRTIALVETPEIEHVENRPFYPLEEEEETQGLLGQLVGELLDIETKEEPPVVDLGKELTEALAPFNPRLNAALLDRVEADLTRKGFTVVRVPPGTRNDPTGTGPAFDAVLDIAVVSAGYTPRSDAKLEDDHPSYPFVYVTELLIDANGKRLLDRIMCSGSINIGNPRYDILSSITVGGHAPRYGLRDQQEVLQRPQRALAAFYDGVATLADLVSRDFAAR